MSQLLIIYFISIFLKYNIYTNTMSFVNEASKLLTNKYFLYFIVFLAITNVIGYLVTNKLNAIVFFALICLLMANFSKNMVVILLVAIVATNLLMVNSRMREGMENAPELTDEQKQQVQAAKNKRSTNAAETVSRDADTTTDPDTTATVSASTTTNAASKVDQIKAKVQAKKASTDDADTTDATEAVPATDEGFAPAGVGANGKKRGAIGGPAKPSRIDYASTLEDAYDNLDKILGSGGMQNLSADTEKLMNQQKKLFEAMNTMMPLVSKAQDMLQGLDMGKIGQMVDMTKTMSPAKV
jgi:hypothetical protein